MKCRLYKKPDGSVIYNWPAEEYQHTDELIAQCPTPDFCVGLPYIIVSEEQLPNESSGNFYHEQVYVNGVLSIENLVVDSAWTERLMPNFLIRKNRINKINAIIDAELNTVDPDMAEIMRKTREKEILLDYNRWESKNLTLTQKNNNDLQMAQLALSELDARVANGEPDKPVIRQKLEQKIQDLT